MLTTSLTLLIAAIAAFWLGFYLRDIRDRVKELFARVKTDKSVYVQEQPQKSIIIEPRDETPSERASREQAELIDRLNPR